MAEFPKVKLKTGKPSLNLNIMNAVVHCQAKCRPTQNDMTGFCVDFENMACNQNWYKPNEDKWKQDQKNWNQRKKTCRGWQFKVSISVLKNKWKMVSLWSTNKSSAFSPSFIEQVHWRSENLMMWWYQKEARGSTSWF